MGGRGISRRRRADQRRWAWIPAQRPPMKRANPWASAADAMAFVPSSMGSGPVWERSLSVNDAAECPSNQGAVLSPPPWGRMLVGVLATLLLAGHGSLAAGEVKGAKFVLAWGKKGDKPGEFSSPIGI